MIQLKQIEDWLETIGEHFLRKDQDDTSSGKITAEGGFDAGGQKITSVADAVEDDDVPSFAQLKTYSRSTKFGGQIHGYIKVVSTVVKFFWDNDADNLAEENSSPADNSLYVVIESTGVTIGGTLYPANTILLHTTGSTYIADNSQNSFDPLSTDADPDGTLDGVTYQMSIGSLTGDYLPFNSSEWPKDSIIHWNGDYDSTPDDDIGRWEISSQAGTILSTKDIVGSNKAGRGIAVPSAGTYEAEPDTLRGMSWSDNPAYPGQSNRQRFGMSVDPEYFYFAESSGALKFRFRDSGKIHLASGDIAQPGLFADIIANSLEWDDLDFDLQSLIKNIDRKHIIPSSSGSISWDSATNTLTWTGDITFRVKIAGDTVETVLSAGSKTMATSGEGLFIPFGATTTASGATLSTTYPPDKLLVCFRSGTSIVFCDSSVIPTGVTGFKLGGADWSLISSKPSTFPASSHTHDDLYPRWVDEDYTDSDDISSLDFSNSPTQVSIKRRSISSLQPVLVSPNVRSDTNKILTSGTLILSALSPAPLANSVMINVNGEELALGNQFTMSGNQPVISRANLGYDLATTDKINIRWIAQS